MKPYMLYSRSIGPSEGAGLVFADSSHDAKIIGWRAFCGELFDEYLDVGCKLIVDAPWLDKEKKYDQPHAVLDPRSCSSCNRWGHSPIGEDNLCEGCREDFQILDTRG